MKKILLFGLLLCLICPRLLAQVTPSSIVPITATTLGKYEKFELGVALSSSSFANQFDPNEIEVYAVFKFLASGATYRINAFWFQDFNRNESSPDPTNNNPCDINAVGISDPAYLTTKATPLPWRIRFAPNAVGAWTYQVFVRYAGQTVSSTTYNLNCTASGKNGYIGVGAYKTHFAYTNTGNPRIESGFLPLGVNVMDKGSIPFNRAAHLYAKGIMQKLASVNGNTIRLFMSPEQFGIEWKEDGLGRYLTRQNRAFNLDQIFDIADELGIKIQLVVTSNHEFHNQADGAQGGYNFWANNPYRALIGTQYDFFTNAQCIDLFKRRMRYVIARWGYSPSLLAYELWNEVDIMVGASPAFWDNNNPQKVKDWHNNIINYAKTLDKNHMYTTSTGFTVCGTAVGTDNIPFFSIPTLDYVQDHYYSNDMNVPYNYSVFAQHSTKKYGKPYITGEIGSQGCWFGNINFTHNNFTGGNYAHDMMEFHNAIWSSLFNSSAGPTYSWDSKNLFNSCWGGPYKGFAPMAQFLQGDDFFTKHLIYMTNKPGGSAGPKDDPNHALGNNSLPFWSYPNYSSPSQLASYLNYSIGTTNDELIDVFAAKSDEGRIQGWVHHRKNYWYELPHTSGDANTPMCNDFNDNQPSSPANIPNLYRESFTINNVACDGMYKVDFYSTYPEYDVNGDNVNENGGIIAPLSQSWLQAYCGVLTIPIPTLSPLSPAGSTYAPDYAFKISKIQDYWSHSLVIGGVTQLNRMSNNTSARTFYSDNNGAIRAVIFDNASNTFQHELISPASPPPNDRSFASICANDNTSVFYKGADSKLQCYYWDNTAWSHIWMTDWNNNSQDIAGNIAIANGNVYYEGVDNKIHRFKYVGVPTWQHSILPNPTNDPNMNMSSGSIAVNDIGTQVYYKGADGRLQCYYLDNVGNWQHVWMTDWANTSQNVAGDMKAVTDGIYYSGTDGMLHRYHYNFSTSMWEHDLLRDAVTNQPIPIPANTDISLQDNADQIFYKGSDNNMHHLYAKNGNIYSQDLVICYNDLNSSYQPNGRIVTQSDGSTFYIGLNDNFIHMYAFDSGCNPREEKTGKRPEAPTPSRLSRFGEEPAQVKVPMIEQIRDAGNTNTAAFVKVFPNPFATAINVNSSKGMPVTVKIFDVYGRLVHTADKPSENHKISTAAYPAGIYLISVLSGGNTIQTEKMVKN